MLNYNGTLIEKESFQLQTGNRGFAYGDSLFETIRVIDGQVRFLEDHYFRLMASMRMIRMQIPMTFTYDYLSSQIDALLATTDRDSVLKVKCTVYRNDGGLYTPSTHEVSFILEAIKGEVALKEQYEIDLFKDHYVCSGLLSTLKSTNRLINVLSSIFATENDLDNCLLINEKKQVVEAANANIFLVKGTHISTPELLSGCIKGIARKKIIEMLEKSDVYTIEECAISPFEIMKADEVFLTNAVMGMQSVTKYRKKKFSTAVGGVLSLQFNALQ
jgi:branched-chain amino acid aminotransferase